MGEVTPRPKKKGSAIILPCMLSIPHDGETVEFAQKKGRTGKSGGGECESWALQNQARGT